MSKSYSQEHGKIEAPDELDSEVKTLSVSLRATSGVTDLSFITRLRVTMAPYGVLPEHDWTGDVTAHFSGTIKYKS